MKKILALLLSSLLVFALAACGAERADSNTSVEKNVTSDIKNDSGINTSDGQESGNYNYNSEEVESSGENEPESAGAYNGNWDDTADLSMWLGDYYDYYGSNGSSFKLVAEGKAYKIIGAKLYCDNTRSLIDAPDTPLFSVDDFQWEDSGYGDGSKSGTILIEEGKYAYTIYINCHDRHLSYTYWDYSSDDILDWTSCYCEGSKNKVSSDAKYYQTVKVTHWNGGELSAVLLDLYYMDVEYNLNYPSELIIYYDGETGYCKEAIMKLYCFAEKDDAEQKTKRLFENGKLGDALSNYSIGIKEQSEWDEICTVLVTANVDLNNCSTPSNVDHYLRGKQDIARLLESIHESLENCNWVGEEPSEGSNYIVDPIDGIRIEW